MAYGVDAPNGLVPKGFMLGSLPSSGLASQALVTLNIENGYAQNIGLGDPVVWLSASSPVTQAAGYIGSAADTTTPSGNLVNVVNTPILGVFAGCQYSTDSEIFQNLPMKLSWRAGTTTSDGSDPVAFVILATYQPGFSVQTGVDGCLRTGLFQMGQLVFTLSAGKVVLNGDQSTVYCNMTGGVGAPYDANGATSFQVMGFDETLGTPSRSVSNPGLPYGNVIGRIANSPFPTFSTPSNF